MKKYIIIFCLWPIIGLAQWPTPEHHFTVIAHRGYHQRAPENTLKAVEDAIAIGADYVEIDLRTTNDGVLINMHDASLKRMCGIDKQVNKLTYAEIKTLKVRDEQHPEFGEHAIPTFEEILHFSKGRIAIYIDFKDADVLQTLDYIKQAQMENAVVVYVYTKTQLDVWRALAPQIPIIISLPEKVKSTKKMKEVLQAYPTNILDGNYKAYSSITVKAAQKSGVPVWADIQSASESSKQWKKAIKTGMKGLQTDHPKELIDYLMKQGVR